MKKLFFPFHYWCIIIQHKVVGRFVMKKRYLILLAGLGVLMTFFLTACSLAEKAAETVSEDKMFIIMIAVIVAVILGVSLGVGIPLRRAQEKKHKEWLEQQSEYENRAARRARQYKRKK